MRALIHTNQAKITDADEKLTLNETICLGTIITIYAFQFFGLLSGSFLVLNTENGLCLNNATYPFKASSLKPFLSCCASGGVGLTLLVVFICYQVFRKKKLKESKGHKDEEGGNSTVVNHNDSHLDVGEMRRDFFLQARSTKPRNRESMTLDRVENQSGQFWIRAEEDSSHFRCPDCSTAEQRGNGSNMMRWNNRINREVEADEERVRWKMRMVTEEGRGQRGILSKDNANKVKVSSQPKRETFNERPENLPAYETGGDMDSYKIYGEGKGAGYENVQCGSCHRTYRPQEQTIRPGRMEPNRRDSTAFNGFPPQHRLTLTDKNHSQFDMVKTTDLRREPRNVTFDLESLGTLKPRNVQGKDKDKGVVEVRTSRDIEREKRAKGQSSRLLKVKLNLNPLRRSKVHPKRKNEQDHLEKDSSKKRNEKRQQRGKDRQEKGGKGKSSNKTKASGEKLKKSRSRRPSDDSGKEKVGEHKEEGTKTNSEKEKIVQGESNSQTGEIPSSADESTTAAATGQKQHSQGGSAQYQGAGLVHGSAEPSSKLPFSLSAAERNHANFPLLASAGSRLSGSNLSLQGGNILLNTVASGFKTLFPNSQANSVAPSITVSGPNLARGPLDSFSGQTGIGLRSPATALLIDTVHANPLQSSVIQTAAFHNSQAGGLDLNLAAINPESTQSLFQSHIPLLDIQKAEVAQVPGLHTRQEFHQLLLESQAPQIKESLPVQAQAPADGLSVLTSQTLGSAKTVENLSNTETETVRVARGSTSAGGADLAAGPAAAAAAAGVPGDSTQAGDVSVSGVSGSATGDAAEAVVLLHQEYLSEEGDSSPRRKLRLALPEKPSSRPPTALERKIR